MVNVTQQDLHDLLEIFERKSFEAAAFEEGTAVSYHPGQPCLWVGGWVVWSFVSVCVTYI